MAAAARVVEEEEAAMAMAMEKAAMDVEEVVSIETEVLCEITKGRVEFVI